MGKKSNLAQPGQYLCVSIGQDIFGLPVKSVIEITQIKNIQPVPQAADYVEGIFTLRGQVVPVINLSKKFKRPSGEKKSALTIVVISSPQGLIGVIVDTVSEVIQFNQGDITHPPAFMNQMTHEFVTGIGKFKDNLVIMIDLLADLAEKLIVEAEKDDAKPDSSSSDGSSTPSAA